MDGNIYEMYNKARQNTEILNSLGISKDKINNKIGHVSDNIYNSESIKTNNLRDLIEANDINENILNKANSLRSMATDNHTTKLLEIEGNSSKILAENNKLRYELEIQNIQKANSQSENISKFINDVGINNERISSLNNLDNINNLAGIKENFHKFDIEAANTSELARYSNLKNSLEFQLGIKDFSAGIVNRNFIILNDCIKEISIEDTEDTQEVMDTLKNFRNSHDNLKNDYFIKKNFIINKFADIRTKSNDRQFYLMNQTINAKESCHKLEIFKAGAELSKQKALEMAKIEMTELKNLLENQYYLNEQRCKIKEKITDNEDKSKSKINVINSDHYRDNLLETRSSAITLGILKKKK